MTGYNVHGAYPSDGNPLGNPPYPGYTTAAGPNWVFFVYTLLILGGLHRH
jgi:hypothetical protein